MRVLVCGGRHYNDVATLWRELDNFAKTVPEPGISCVIDGASDDVTGPYVGADYWANQWAIARDRETIRCHAKWGPEGRAAGPIRNRHMLEHQNPDVVIAFPGGRGTANMMRLARSARIRVIEIGSTEAKG